MANNKKLTKWEAGNELAKASDALCDVFNELRDWPELRKAVAQAQRKIHKVYCEKGFNKEMKFGICQLSAVLNILNKGNK